MAGVAKGEPAEEVGGESALMPAIVSFGGTEEVL
jgi:hypothetical protein